MRYAAMSKYDLLTKSLKSFDRPRIPMSFREIERVLGFTMPASSRSHRAWWSNNPSNNVMTKAWLAAGYHTEEVDLEEGRLVFVKSERQQPLHASTENGRVRHPAWGALKGTTKVEPGVNLAAPADPDWGAVYGR